MCGSGAPLGHPVDMLCGPNLEVIQRLLGHASISTAQIYAQVDDAASVAAILTRSHGI